jgi:hypothetical protein
LNSLATLSPVSGIAWSPYIFLKRGFVNLDPMVVSYNFTSRP